MALRPCLDCKRPARGSRCADCERVRDQARGTRQQRGYDAGYDSLRRTYAARIKRGETVLCWRCGQPVTLAFHLGHCDDDRRVMHGPEHSHENLGARGPCPHPDHDSPTTEHDPTG